MRLFASSSLPRFLNGNLQHIVACAASLVMEDDSGHGSLHKAISKKCLWQNMSHSKNVLDGAYIYSFSSALLNLRCTVISGISLSLPSAQLYLELTSAFYSSELP